MAMPPSELYSLGSIQSISQQNCLIDVKYDSFSFLNSFYNIFAASFLSTGGTSTGTPVRVYKIMKKFKNRFRDYLTLRYFPQRVESELQ